jgi:hypothetical protein
LLQRVCDLLLAVRALLQSMALSSKMLNHVAFQL